MWIVRLALNRPYTFVVVVILILLLSPAVILRTPTDIFPNIDIPVISVAWTYTGLNPEDLETRLTTPFAKGLTTLRTRRTTSTESAQQHQPTTAAEESLKLFQNRYAGGVDTYLQVVTSQTTALTNERNDIDILRRRLEANVLLIKAMGGGWNISNLPQL